MQPMVTFDDTLVHIFPLGASRKVDAAPLTRRTRRRAAGDYACNPVTDALTQFL